MYLPMRAATLIPATVHDATKSLVAANSSVPLLQGTYWCEAWLPGSAAPLASNKVLITLQGREVLLLHLRSRGQISPLTARSLEARLRESFASVHGFDNFPIDVVSLQEDEPESLGLVGARAQIHLPAASDAFATVLHMLHADRVMEGMLENAGFLASSTVTLPTRCRNTTVALPGGNTVSWPFTEAGRVQPRHYRCEADDGGLLSGICRWNYTHGAAVHFNPRRCQRFDFCPRGYTGLAGSFCVFLAPTSTWEEGVEVAHGISGSMSLLDSVRLHEARGAGVPSLYKEVQRWLSERGVGRVLWLPARRLTPFGPLTFVGPISSEFPIDHHSDLHNFSVSWAKGQPAAEHDCLALNTETSRLLTLPCSASLPFLSVLDVRGLLTVPSEDWRDAAPNLLTKNPLCSEKEDWESSGYPGGEDSCFKVFIHKQKLSWEEAAEACAERGAHLPDPSHGFLDWSLRQLLYNQNIPSVWIRVPPQRVLREVSSREGTFLNWQADSDASLPHAALTPRGWVHEAHGTAKTHVMCQRHIQPPKVTLYVFKKAGSVFVEVQPRDAPTVGRVHCYVNGREVQAGGEGDLLELDNTTQGYYKCRTWVGTPLHLVLSNTLLHTRHATHTFSVTLHRQWQYTPSHHDATFSPSAPTRKDICVETLLKGLRQGFIDVPGVQVMTDNFYFTPDNQTGALFIHFQVEVDITHARNHLAESEAAEIVVAALGRLSATPCRAGLSRSTWGCYGEIEHDNEMNLTWPATCGSKAVLPTELCVNEEGEPVTRECIGDFIRGYHWGERSGKCTDEPLNTTQQLWKMNQDSSSSDAASLATLTAHGHSLTAADVHFVSQKMQSISREATVTDEDLEFLVETLNNVMEAEESVFGEVQRLLNTSSILLDAFENITLRVQPPRADQPVRGHRRLVSVERVDATPDSSIIGYQTWKKDDDGDEEEAGLSEEDTLLRKEREVDWRRSQVTLILPDGLTQRVASKSGTAASARVPLTFAVYRNPKLFRDNTTFPNHTVDGHIIQASYGGHSVTHLPQPVKIYFKIDHEGNESKCVFWDFQENGGRGGWSAEGCRSGGRHGEHLLCLCDHLTCFARLVTFDGQGATGVHVFILDIISYVGCSLSIFSLLLVLFTFLLFQKWRRRLSNKILASLATSVLCSLIVFMAGIQQTLIPLVCRGVAVALHYFILASFGWMLVEAVHQYLKFVKVVGTYIPRFMWKASVCAWGAPFVPIIAVLVYDSTLYDSDQRPDDKICWMSSTAFKYAFLPPLAATMTTNLVLFVLIVNSATCGRVRITSTLSERQLRLTQLRMAVSVFFLLGFTWVFGLLTFWRPSLVFSYLFCVSNTLQGFFIFLFHVFRERDARRLWRDFLSVISRDSSTSSCPRSLSLPTPRYSGQPSRALDSHSVSYNQQGEVSLHPRGPAWDTTRGSVRSTRTVSTLTHSRSSTPPAC